MLKDLSILLKRYGLIEGLSVYTNLKFGKTGAITLPNLHFPLHYRAGSIDKFTIIDIFGLKCYDIELPFVPDFIIDGGANIGVSSIFFANKYPGAQIIAVEPESSNYELLLRNANFYSKIKPLKNAIWSSSTYLTVKDRGYGLRGFTVEESPESTPKSFKACTIDELMEENKYIDILKIDIEGSEKEVFSRNYEKWLPNVRCLIIELHDRMVDGCTESLMTTMGKYNFSHFSKGENLVFLNKELL